MYFFSTAVDLEIKNLEVSSCEFAAVRESLLRPNLGIKQRYSFTGDLLTLQGPTLFSAAELVPQYEIALVPHFARF